MESGFPLDIPIDELCVARESAQIKHVHMNAFDGKFWGWTFPEGEGTEGMFGYGGAAWTLGPLVCSKGPFLKQRRG